jgi:hypothetical protein
MQRSRRRTSAPGGVVLGHETAVETVRPGPPADPAAATPPPPRPRAFTVKALLAALLGIAVVSLYSNTNDRVLQLSPLIGNHMPVAAFSLVLLLAVAWNPLIGRWSQRLLFGTRELALVLALMLISSWIPGSSFYRYFHGQVIGPWIDAKTHPEWEKQGTLTYLPDRLFPLAHDPGTDDARYPPGSPERQEQVKRYERVYDGFRTGIAVGNHDLTWKETPIQEWLPSMRYWWPLALSMGVCMMAMIWLLHRQWAHHEQLAYPISSVATALITRTGNRLTSDLFYSRLFWGGFIPVFGLHLINLLNAWFPDYVPKIQLSLWFMEHHNNFPVLWTSGDATCPMNIYFSIIGLAYFIPSEIGLSMGLSAAVQTIAWLMFYLSSGSPVSEDDRHDTLAGAYLAYFCILLWTGRHYYRSVFARALWLRPAAPHEVQQAWAGRYFLIGAAGFIIALRVCFGLDWFLAVLYAGSLMIYFLVFARVIVETGVPFLQANFDTGWTICQVLGFPAVGPAAAVLMVYLDGTLNPDARECVTPYVANSIKIAEGVGLKVPRMLALGAVAMVVALVLGFLGQTNSLYSKGTKNDELPLQRVDQRLDQSTRALAALRETGLFEQAESTRGLAKLGLVGKNAGHARELGWLAFGMVGVLALSLMRFRYTWWPLHPVIFLMWGTWTSQMVWVPFLLGWVVKTAIVRYGGGRTYQQLKPLFIGMIMGEIVVVTVTLAIGFIYYMATGLVPKSYVILPR